MILLARDWLVDELIRLRRVGGIVRARGALALAADKGRHLRLDDWLGFLLHDSCRLITHVNRLTHCLLLLLHHLLLHSLLVMLLLLLLLLCHATDTTSLHVLVDVALVVCKHAGLDFGFTTVKCLNYCATVRRLDW